MNNLARTLPPLALATLAAGILVGCAPSAPSPQVPDTALSHVHGIALDDAGGTVVVATHQGVYRLPIDGEAGGEPIGPVGGLDIDTMGFTLIDDVAYASGHPGPTTPPEFLGPNLGLIRSENLGEIWTEVSLGGETDFHDLSISESAPDRIYGLTGPLLRRSDDGGATWVDLAGLEARDILTPSGNPDRVYATTAEGLMLSVDAGATFSVRSDAPALFLVTEGGTADGSLTGIDVAGSVWVQDGEDGAWTSAGTVVGTPQAMYVVPGSGRLIVADDRGLMISDDDGLTWNALWTA